MKVAINARPAHGPWGGGNRFVLALAECLSERGHEPTYGLSAEVDLVLLVDPRTRNPQTTFTPGQAFRQLVRRPQTVIVHRINECDERKGTRTMNARLRLANYTADHTVLIASWLRDLSVWRRESGVSVILNGADERIFKRDSARKWDGKDPLRLVTHHWGAHAKKGWDVYGRIDAMLDEPRWRDRLCFTYIGNVPAAQPLRHIEHVPPLDGASLASALADHHVYVTASVNEPAGMHHIEGALCGLPLLFRRSGALPEYCTGFGEAFDDSNDIEAAVERMMASYQQWKAKMPAYENTASRMSNAYVDLFEELHARRDAIAGARRLWRSPLAALAIQAPM